MDTLCFDVLDPVTTFCKSLELAVGGTDNGTAIRTCQIRIITGYVQHTCKQKIWRIYVYSKDDALSVHIMQCTEEDYGRIRSELALRVDHACFPGKVACLLDRCARIEHPEASSVPHNKTGGYELVLELVEGAARLMVVEQTDFSRVVHLNLLLHQAKGTCLERFLAFRLAEEHGSARALSLELQETQQEHLRAQASAAREKEEHQRALAEARASLLQVKESCHADQQRSAQQGQREMHLWKEVQERDRATQQATYEAALRATEQRIALLESSNATLREQAMKQQQTLAEAQHLAACNQGHIRTLMQRIQHLLAVGEEQATREGEGEQVRARLLQELEVQRSSAETLKSRALAAEEKAAVLQAAVQEHEMRWQSAVGERSEAERRAQEASRSCAELRGELETAQSHAQKTEATMLQLRSQLQQSQNILQSMHDSVMEAESKANAAQAARTTMQHDYASVKSQLESTAAELLKVKETALGSDKMVRWLNAQLTEAHMRTSSLSRCQMPASTAPPVPHFSAPTARQPNSSDLASEKLPRSAASTQAESLHVSAQSPHLQADRQERNTASLSSPRTRVGGSIAARYSVASRNGMPDVFENFTFAEKAQVKSPGDDFQISAHPPKMETKPRLELEPKPRTFDRTKFMQWSLQGRKLGLNG